MLDFVRSNRHLKGTKSGCLEGDCGACTVLIGELKDGEIKYQNATSCITPLGNLAGKHVVTIEGVNVQNVGNTEGVLTPVQQAMNDEAATQCGFCTVGFVMSMTGFCLSSDVPNKDNILSYLIGLAVVCLVVGAFLFATRGAHVELKGSILKVRTHPSDESNSIAIVDFRFVNPSDYPFMVRNVTVFVEDKQGNSSEGQTISDMDVKRLFDYYKEIGPKYNDTLMTRARVNPKQSLDRMIAASFPMTQEKFEQRKRIKLVVEEIDGPVSELVESAK